MTPPNVKIKAKRNEPSGLKYFTKNVTNKNAKNKEKEKIDAKRTSSLSQIFFDQTIFA